MRASLSRRLLSLTVMRPRLVLGFIVVVSAVMMLGISGWPGDEPGLRVSGSVDPLLPQDDEIQEIYRFSQKMFGDAEVVIVGLRSESALSEQNLALLAELHKALNALPQVQTVLSLHNASLAREYEGGTEVWPLPDWLTRFGLSRESLQAELVDHPLYQRSLISDDGTVAGMIIRMGELENRARKQHAQTQELMDVLDHVAASSGIDSLQVHIGGSLIVKAQTLAAFHRGFSFMLPAILLVFLVLLTAAFRSVRGVLLPLMTIVLGLLWTLGLMAWMGHELNLVTVIIPPLIMTLGLAYSIHILAPYYELAERWHGGPRSLLSATLKRIARPLGLTGITTVVGFLALSFSPLPGVRDFAWFSALGVSLTVFLALSFLPASLAMFGTPRHIRRTDVLMPLFSVLSRLVVRFRWTILIVGGLVVLASIAAATQIRVGSNFIADFPADSRVRQDHAAINQSLGGANVFNILIRADLNDAFVQPDSLQALDELEAWLEAQPEIGVVNSMLDALRQIDVAFGGDPDNFQIPKRASTVKQLFALGGSESLYELVDPRFRVSNLIVRATPEDSFELADLVARIEQRLAALPRPLEAHVTGNAVVITRSLQKIAEGQIVTLGIAMLVIYLILSVVFTSPRSALLALLPNLLPIAVYYGVLGLTGIPLSPTTGLIACIVLGIAVDDTIHYLVRFNSEARRLRDETAATATALKDVLRPVSLTTIALVLGFLVLTHSELKNQAQFGALAAFTLAIAWLSDVSFTPALAAKMRIVTFWDVLRFNLGAQPQYAIPLFHGLNIHQARTFALLARERTCTPGETLFNQGDAGDDLFVVIQGHLNVYIPQDSDEDLLVNELRRGDVVGEVGFFTKEERSATVVANNHTRLLQFSAQDLDQIARRRPLLGARIFRNLNLIQAQRMQRLSQRLA